jgi:hypothetical protein
VNFRVPIAQHNAEPGSLLLQHQQQVTSLLGDPGGVGVGGHSGQVDPPGVQFDEEQHIQPPQRGGVDGEEVARRDSRGLLAEERSPSGGGPPRCRIQAVAVQRGADRGGRDSHAEVHQFALDALVAPARVLCGEADDQLLDDLVELWPPLADTRVGPRARDEAPVPAQQRLRGDEEAGPAGSG